MVLSTSLPLLGHLQNTPLTHQARTTHFSKLWESLAPGRSDWRDWALCPLPGCGGVTPFGFPLLPPCLHRLGGGHRTYPSLGAMCKLLWSCMQPRDHNQPTVGWHKEEMGVQNPKGGISFQLHQVSYQETVPSALHTVQPRRQLARSAGFALVCNGAAGGGQRRSKTTPPAEGGWRGRGRAVPTASWRGVLAGERPSCTFSAQLPGGQSHSQQWPAVCAHTRTHMHMYNYVISAQ